MLPSERSVCTVAVHLMKFNNFIPLLCQLVLYILVVCNRIAQTAMSQISGAFSSVRKRNLARWHTSSLAITSLMIFASSCARSNASSLLAEDRSVYRRSVRKCTANFKLCSTNRWVQWDLGRHRYLMTMFIGLFKSDAIVTCMEMRG